MIRNTKQVWEPGHFVKVGFLQLKVVAKVPAPWHNCPDAYALESNGRWYRFVPHHGIERVSSREEAVAY